MLHSLLMIATIAPGPTLQAPVYVQMGESMMRRHGTFTYKPSEAGYEILLCIATPPKVMIKCLVRTPADLLVMIEAQATEQGT